MCVHMDCPGCEKKIRKAVQRLEGVHDVEIDMAQQRVTVNGDVEQKKVLKAVRRTGRRAVLWPLPYAAGAAAGGAGAGAGAGRPRVFARICKLAGRRQRMLLLLLVAVAVADDGW